MYRPSPSTLFNSLLFAAACARLAGLRASQGSYVPLSHIVLGTLELDASGGTMSGFPRILKTQIKYLYF